MTAFRGAIGCVLAAACGFAQSEPPAVNAMLRQARAEIRDFEKAGGKKDDPQHPVEKWVQKLWAARLPTATVEAVHLLIHADRFQEARDRADMVAADDAAWDDLPQVLLEAASMQKDHTYFFRKLDTVLAKAPDQKVRAAIELALGRGWREQKEDAKAESALRAARDLAPDSVAGRQAETELYDLLHLGPGQPAPFFTAAAVNSSNVSLADYRGKPLVLVFWATH
jgi:hypothetical protein